MKSIVLTVAITLLAVSTVANWALLTGRLGSSRYEFAKVWVSKDDYRLASMN